MSGTYGHCEGGEGCASVILKEQDAQCRSKKAKLAPDA